MADFNPYGIQSQQLDIDQQRKLAQMLQATGQQGSQGQMVSGHYVGPSRLGGIASLLSQIGGGLMQGQADSKQKALAQAIATKKQEWMQGLPQATPAQSMDMGTIDPSMAQYGQLETAPATQPTQKDMFNWGMQGMAIDPEMAKMAMALSQKSGPEYSQKPEIDQNGRAYVLDKQGNVKYLQGTNGNIGQRDKLENVNGVFVNPYTAMPKAIAPQDVNKPMYYGPDGKMTANEMYQKYELSKAQKGATNVNVKTDVKTGESLAAQVGPMMKDSASQAEAAVKQVDAAQRVVKAVDSNKLFVGPGANTKLKATQIFDTFGVAGADDAEKLANTRQAIRGLAELTLQGRQQMKGQGAITESEGKLAEKAMSGDITDLTAAELKQLAKASERAARFNYAQHERRMNSVRDKPEFKAVAPFYEAPQMPAEQAGGATPSSGGWSINPVP